LYLVIDAPDQSGTAAVIDGGLDLVPGRREPAISGTALIQPSGPLRGSFSLFGRDGAGPDGWTFFGAFSCG
jgi:hypothetical protein